MMDGAGSARGPGSDQTALRRAILDPDSTAPAGITDGDARPAQRRFAVYRNNVVVSLTEALEAAFPVVARLVGGEFFRTMAGTFVRAHPPRSPLMMLYGAEFPAFLASFPPVAPCPTCPMSRGSSRRCARPIAPPTSRPSTRPTCRCRPTR